MTRGARNLGTRAAQTTAAACLPASQAPPRPPAMSRLLVVHLLLHQRHVDQPRGLGLYGQARARQGGVDRTIVLHRRQHLRRSDESVWGGQGRAERERADAGSQLRPASAPPPAERASPPHLEARQRAVVVCGLLDVGRSRVHGGLKHLVLPCKRRRRGQGVGKAALAAWSPPCHSHSTCSAGSPTDCSPPSLLASLTLGGVHHDEALPRKVEEHGARVRHLAARLGDGRLDVARRAVDIVGAAAGEQRLHALRLLLLLLRQDQGTAACRQAAGGLQHGSRTGVRRGTARASLTGTR